MKKLIAIVLLACMLSAALFASESYIGASINSKFDFGFEEYENVKKDFSEGYLGFGVDMATYFGECKLGYVLEHRLQFPAVYRIKWSCDNEFHHVGNLSGIDVQLQI